MINTGSNSSLIGIALARQLALVVMLTAGALNANVLAEGSPAAARGAAPTVSVDKLPEGGIQPQAAVDSKGIVHIVYFKGKPEAGDLFYYHYPVNAGPTAGSTPIRVNSKPNTAIAAGTIRTEQIALGKGDRLHVVWNGVGAKTPQGYNELYMAYTRLNESGTEFEPQRNLCQWTGNLDGGGSVAADRAGSVYATWHTAPPGNKEGESGRGVWLSLSHDNGATFDRERMINPDPTGACGCCSMRAFADRTGVVRVLYREADQKGSQRATMLLTSADKGKSFSLRILDPWAINACPMSSMSLADDNSATYAAWETREQVFWSPIASNGSALRPGTAAPGAAKSKHPIVVANGKGQVLFAWTEGTGWQKGGSYSWQIYDDAGKPIGPRGHEDGLPVWSLLSGYARPDGSFVIVR